MGGNVLEIFEDKAREKLMHISSCTKLFREELVIGFVGN